MSDKITSFINDVFDEIYPIGSIYMSHSTTNPSQLFGGYWAQIKDTFLLAAGNTYTNGSTGGEATHTLTISEMPSHRHQQTNGIVFQNNRSLLSSKYTIANQQQSGVYTQNTGGDSNGNTVPHNNMPPYYTVNVWEKVAGGYYKNTGNTLDGLKIIGNNVSCTIQSDWITITTNTNGEKYVFPPVAFTGSDNWEMSFQCKTSNYSGQAFGVQMENADTTRYSGDNQYISYSGTSLNMCMGYGDKTGVSLSDNDLITIRRLDGYWIILVNNVEQCRKSYTWTNLRVPGFYTNSGRTQRIKNLTIKRI